MLRIAPVEMTGKRMLGIAWVFAKATPNKPVEMIGKREGVIAQAQG